MYYVLLEDVASSHGDTIAKLTGKMVFSNSDFDRHFPIRVHDAAGQIPALR
jgi:hypothetical protein